MMSREELVIWLRDAISAETDKPENEIDYEFVNECMALLSELITDEYNLSPEQIKSKVRKITSNHSTVSAKKKPVKMKRLVAIAVAAAVLLCGAVVAFAASPTLRQMVMSVLGMEVGERIEQNGITYINSGEGKVYSDIAELVEKEGLDIMYPHQLPKGLEISKVIKLENENKILIVFNNEKVSISIQLHSSVLENILTTDQVIVYNEIEFYDHSVCSNNDYRIRIYTFDNNMAFYSIIGENKSIIYELIQYIY